MQNAIESISILFLVYLFFFIFSIRKNKKVFFNPYGSEWSTCIKGIAIIIIVLGHLGNLFGMRYFTPLGAIGVSCFLIVSGYGLSASFEKNGLKGYWKKKLPIYIVYVFIELFHYTLFIGEFTVVQIIKDILLIEPLHPYGWYMNFIAIWYLVFYLSKKFCNKKIQFVVFFIVGVFWYIFSRELKAQNAFSFLMGVCLYNYKDKCLFILEKIKTLVLFFAVGSLFLALKQIGFVRQLPVLIYKLVLVAICMAFAMSLISLVSVLQKYNKHSLVFPIFNVGKISYELYLIHAFTILIFQHISITFLSLCLVFLSSFALSIVLHIGNKELLKIR